MPTKLVLDDDRTREAFARTAAGAEREPDGPAFARPKRRVRKRDLNELAGRVRFRDDFDCKALRRTRFGEG